MFCLLAVKETSCVGHCNVVTLCVVISGCFNFKSIKKSGGWDRKCNMDHIMVIHGVGPRSSTNITLGAYCIPTKMKDQDSTWEFYYTKSMWGACWLNICKEDRQAVSGCSQRGGRLSHQRRQSVGYNCLLCAREQSTSLLWWVFYIMEAFRWETCTTLFPWLPPEQLLDASLHRFWAK